MPSRIRPPRAPHAGIGRVPSARRALAEQQAEAARLAALRRISLHYGQALAWRAFHHEGYRIVSVMSGTGSGKTWSAPRILYPFLQNGGLERTHLWCEPTYKMLTRVMLPTVLPFLDAYHMGTFRKGDMLYELRGGGRILFGSVDSPNSLQGAHIDGTVWADEVGLYSEEAWDVLEQRAALYKAPILATSTPYTLPWVEERLAKPTDDPKQHTYKLVHFPSWWNPQYPIDEYRRQKRMLPPDKFARLFDGLFVRISGLVFDSFSPQANVASISVIEGTRRIHVQPTGGGTAYEVEIVRARLGQDWGWAPDPGVQLLAGYDSLGRCYILSEDYETHVQVERGTNDGADTWISRALSHHARWGLEMVACDPSRPSDIQLMRDYGLPAVGAENAIERGIDLTNEAMHDQGGGYGAGLVIAANACPNLVREIGSYVRQRRADGEGYLPKPAPNQSDHAADALRYLLAGERRKDEKHVIGTPPVILGAKRGSGNSGGQRRQPPRETATPRPTTTTTPTPFPDVPAVPIPAGISTSATAGSALPYDLSAIIPKGGLAAHPGRGRR